jgi:hypothetical protein
VTVTVVPTGPVVGLSEIAAVTENVADAVFALASVALTVCEPNVEAGTAKVVPAGIAPPEVVVTVT